MIKHIYTAAMVLALATVAHSANFTVGNGPPNQTGGSDMNGFLEADSFVITPATINQISFWTLQGSAADYAGSTYWGIYTDATGVPGTAIASGNPVLAGVADGNTTFGLNEYAYQFAVNVPLSAGTYWLVLHNGPTNTIPNTTYYWAWAADSGNSQSRDLSVGGSTWVPNSSALAFNLTATATAATPEPATMALVGGGLLAAWLGRRKLAGNRTGETS